MIGTLISDRQDNRTCRCTHAGSAHAHFTARTSCSVKSCSCRSFRPARRWAGRLRTAYRWLFLGERTVDISVIDKVDLLGMDGTTASFAVTEHHIQSITTTRKQRRAA